MGDVPEKARLIDSKELRDPLLRQGLSTRTIGKDPAVLDHDHPFDLWDDLLQVMRYKYE